MCLDHRGGVLEDLGGERVEDAAGEMAYRGGGGAVGAREGRALDGDDERRRGEALEGEPAPADLAARREEPPHAALPFPLERGRRPRPAGAAPRREALGGARTEGGLHGLLRADERLGADQDVAR